MSPKHANEEQKALKQVLDRALSGKGAHAASANVFSGLDAITAGERPAGLPHSLFQILNHIVFWQDWVVQWCDGAKPKTPPHASGSWPGAEAPADEAEWNGCVQRFHSGLKGLQRRVRTTTLLAKKGKSPLQMLQAIASHNSYHLGEAVVLRQMLGKWPPPSGGLTW